MYPINENDTIIKRNRKQIVEQVKRFKSVGKTDAEIVHWLENDLDKEISLSSNFDSAHEMAELTGIPVSKFTIFWL